MNVWGGGPGEDEQSTRKHTGANNHERKPLLRNDDTIVLARAPREFGLGMPNNSYGTEHNAHKHAQIGQAADTQLPATDFTEGDRIGDECQIGNSVDEGLVDGYA